jgi:6-phosphogluconolactonase
MGAGAVNRSDLELRVVDDAEAAAREAARLLVGAARAGGEIALSGGSTPRRAFGFAAELEPDWWLARIWWSDERCVPPDDERSNYRLARESLLDRLAAQPAEVHRIRGELAADEAARLYDEELAGRTIDLNLLGLGPDGHTASLFPDMPSLDERERRAVATPPGLEPFVDRVTMTIPMLAASRTILFLVTGAEKAEAAARAFAGPPDRGTPASLVRSAAGSTIALLDRAAAAHIRPT